MGQAFEMPPQLTRPQTNARKAGRVRCQWTMCNLGEIVDLSKTGMRIKCRRKLAAGVGSRVSAIVEGHDGDFDVSGRVVWKKKAGLFRWEIGIEFDELAPASQKGLTLLARAALSNEAIAVQEHARRSA